MPLHIDQVDTEMDILASENPYDKQPAESRMVGLADPQLREYLRPLVLEVLEEELQRLQRHLG